ncbi:MAG TPA: amidohydrolase, partial [Myxococcaceae bacterium]|nr:amidohydrolase [Myxococcaceae bacterium]
RNPELSLREEKTAGKLAAQMRKLGYTVTEKVGGTGVVAVLANGAGPTLLVRTEMDALPLKEQTGLAYASQVTAKDDTGATVSVMHACGHDIHMTSWIGAASLLAGQQERWSGTLVFVAQPAEEVLHGASAMVADGLLLRFPKPDFLLAIHDTADHPAGQVALVPGYAFANSTSVDITLYGKGGHGARPQATIDPVVLAARTVLTLQTLVSREVNPLEPAVVTVGSIHGGTKHNIISDEVKLQLTVRSYSPEVQKQLLAGIERIAKAEAAAARAPKEPVVTVAKDSAVSVYNDPSLTERVGNALRRSLGEQNVVSGDRVMGSEDFGAIGVAAKAPSVLLWVGSAEPGAWAKARASGSSLPNWHTPFFSPDRERTLRTGVSVLTLAALELLRKPTSAPSR